MKHLLHHDNREEYRHEHLQNLIESGSRSYYKIGNMNPPEWLSVAEKAAWMLGNVTAYRQTLLASGA